MILFKENILKTIVLWSVPYCFEQLVGTRTQAHPGFSDGGKGNVDVGREVGIHIKKGPHKLRN